MCIINFALSAFPSKKKCPILHERCFWFCRKLLFRHTTLSEKKDERSWKSSYNGFRIFAFLLKHVFQNQEFHAVRTGGASFPRTLSSSQTRKTNIFVWHRRGWCVPVRHFLVLVELHFANFRQNEKRKVCIFNYATFSFFVCRSFGLSFGSLLCGLVFLG